MERRSGSLITAWQMSVSGLQIWTVRLTSTGRCWSSFGETGSGFCGCSQFSEGSRQGRPALSIVAMALSMAAGNLEVARRSFRG
jgi:hypothetical protein